MRRTLTALILALGFFTSLSAQTKAPVQPADYGQWESLAVVREFGGLSPDGKWLAYGINRSNRENELRVTSITDGTTKTAAFGAQPVFSSDSRWVAYAIGYSETQEEKMRKDKKPVQRKLGLLNLSTGEQIVVDGIESFSFSPTGTYLAMRRYAPEKKDAPDAGANVEEDTPGATLILRQLSSGRDTSFGNVSEFAWQDLPKRGTLLAMTINSEDKTGNGVQLFNSENASVRVLDSSASVYSGLAWRKDSADLAVLRSKSDDHRESATQVALAWAHVGEASEASHTYDPTGDAKFPAGMRTVSFHKPTWSEDGDTVFLGMAKWEEKIVEPKKSEKDASVDSDSKNKDKGKAKDAEEQPTVDIWNARDAEVMPKQKLNAKNDRQKNILCAWHLQSGQFLPLGKDLEEEIVPFNHQQTAYAANWSAYAMERSIGRPAADVYFVDLATGTRTKIQDRLNDDYYLEASPAGHYLLYFHDNNYWTVNTTTHAVVNITKTVPTAFANLEADFTINQKPAFGFAGWTKDDASVILYDKFDLWQVSPDGSHATKLTDGAADQVRHRYVKLNPRDEFIGTDQPMYLSLFGIWTKKSGYARLNPGASGSFKEEHLIWLDKSIAQLGKAKDTDVFEYVEQTFTESPNAFVGGPDLKASKQVTKTNPFQSNYAWGKEELIDYKNSHGEHLQGALYYPAGYDPSKKYPMVVYMYEKLSDGLHLYSAPSERNYYNVGAVTSHGYFMLEPDIVFKPRDPGVSVVDCVTSAVKRVIQMNVIDPKTVGVMGHSYGAFMTANLLAHSDMFRAGIARSGAYNRSLTPFGFQNEERTYWQAPEIYYKMSPFSYADKIKTPILLIHGEADNNTGTFPIQSERFFAALKGQGATVRFVLLPYESHAYQGRENVLHMLWEMERWLDTYVKPAKQ